MPITTSPDFGNAGRRSSECRRRYGVLTPGGRRWLAGLKGESRGWQIDGDGGKRKRSVMAFRHNLCSEPYRLMIWEARAVGSGRNIGTDTAHSQPDGCRICYDGGMMDAIEVSLIWSPHLRYRRLVVLVDAEGRGDLDSRFIKNGSDSLHLIELIEDP